MKIDLQSPAGIRLLTEGKFCTENVDLAPVLQSKTVTENGTVKADEGYVGLELVMVDVPAPEGSITPSGTKRITVNGIYDVSSYAEAEVVVPVGVFPSGTKAITSNGTYDVTDYAGVSVNVPGEVVEEYDGTVTVV